VLSFCKDTTLTTCLIYGVQSNELLSELCYCGSDLDPDLGMRLNTSEGNAKSRLTEGNENIPFDWPSHPWLPLTLIRSGAILLWIP
jgi:hypothetical protein